MGKGWGGGDYRPLHSSFKGFLLTSLPFKQGLNSSKIIAVMSKGNLPQTEAGSSVAVAPGKAELLSFLKCQRGTGTGNTPQCAVISSSSVLKGFCPGKCSQIVSHLFRHSQRHVSPSASKFLQYYSFQSEFKVKCFFFRFDLYPFFKFHLFFSDNLQSSPSMRDEFIHNPRQ